MRVRAWIGVFPLAWVLGTAPAYSAEILTLADCYARALAQSETVGLSLEAVGRAEAQYVALRSAVLPHLGFFSNDRFQDVSDNAGCDSSRRERLDTGFYGRQTVFAVFR